MFRSTRIVSLAAAALALVAISTDAQAQCVVGGAGGTYGTDTLATAGVWDTTLPGSPLVSTLAVTVPSGATVLNSVVLRGLSHTWGGDTHVILQSPAGQQYNVLVLADDTSSGGAGCGDVLGGGDYTIIDAGQAAGCGGAAVMTCGTGYPAGTYAQSFSNWTSGGASVLNTPLEQIPLANGTWTLYLHDWYPQLDSGSLVSWEMCFGSPTPPPPGGGAPLACVTGGAGGFFPQTGAVEGTWPTILPTGQLTSTLAVTIPSGSTTIKGVKLNGLNHTWLGDCQIVLTSPSGTNYNIFQQVDGVFGGGCAGQFAGDYVFVDPVLGTDQCGNPANAFVCPAGVLLPGYYGQFYGAWTSGDAGIVNVNLESIPPANGTWTLSIYDWFIGADGGSLGSWELCFDSGPSAPTSYCTAGTTTNGCNATMTATAQPSVTFATACVLNVANVEGQKQGLIFYGVNNAGFTPTPWGPGSTSFLCVKSPTQRTGTQASGGLSNSCTGSFSLDWNAYQGANPGALGNPFSAGSKVYAQGWFRDPPAPKTTNLSDAVEMTVVP